MRLFITALACLLSYHSFSQDKLSEMTLIDYNQIDLLEHESDQDKFGHLNTPTLEIDHDYGLRKSRRWKYRGLLLSIIGVSVASADEASGVFIAAIGGIMFQVGMVVQDIQTGVFIRDVRGNNSNKIKQSRNNEYNGIL